MSTGRKKDPLWQYFSELSGSGESGKSKTARVKCKYCNKDMVGLIARMRAHLTTCSSKKKNFVASTSTTTIRNQRNDSDSSDDDSHLEEIQVQDDAVDVVGVEPIAKKMRQDSSASTSSQSIMSQFVVKTPQKEKHKIDLQVARYFYATNTPFRHCEHQEFIKLMQLSRPGYQPPNRKNIGGKLLEEVHTTIKSVMEKYLSGKIVCMALDGWTNIRNEPIVCVSVTTTEDDGNVYLIDTIDTADKSHTGEYLLTLAVDSIKKCQSFGCQVRSFVTDNAANMAKMRRELMQLEDDEIGDVITYGCSAHLLNLFAKDIEELEIKNKVKKIIKYFKYHHFPGAKYKEAGGKALKLPQEVRWNTLADCLESYVKNWHCLAKVCSEHRAVLDLAIVRHVQDVELKENVEEYLKKLEKVSMALDTVQRETCILSDCTHIWNDLLSSDWLPNEANKLKARFNAAMTPAHFAAYILDPKYKGEGLSDEQDTMGMEFIDAIKPQAMKDVLTYRAMTFPFKDYMFKDDLLKKTHASVWWKSLGSKLDSGTIDLTNQLFTATASSAGIERLFSTFGLVHSKIRNRLGTEKAAKLVTIMRALNPKGQSTMESMDDLDLAVADESDEE